MLEGSAMQGNEITKKYSKLLERIEILLEYHDEKNNLYYTKLIFEGEEIKNEIFDERPEGFEK